ncbi:hypothetical protein GGF46_001767 [Coemansia sp. RSA 552]|nr:hypothetical protein GGF46_001767 [Coemansia sp. RSA 552]
MQRLRRVISKPSNSQGSPQTLADGFPAPAEAAGDAEERVHSSSFDAVKESSPSFLSIDRWPLLSRSSQQGQQRRRGSGTSPQPGVKHRPSQSFSVRGEWRALRDTASRHKRTSSSSSIFSSKQQPKPKTPQRRGRASSALSYEQHESACGESDFLGYPPGGLEIQNDSVVVVCEQRSPDVCEFVVRDTSSASLHPSNLLAIALVSWAAHIFFRGHIVLALLPMAVYLVRSSLQVCQESLVVIRHVGVQMETVTLAGFRSVRSFERSMIRDLAIHEALQLLEYRYYMAILPAEGAQGSSPIVMFPNLLPRLDELLPVFHGARKLLFPADK